MNQFETHLINDGLHFKTAARHAKVAAKYTHWLTEKNLNIEQVKRSQFTDWLQTYREQGLTQDTLSGKESVIRDYYYFLGTPKNPAESWIVRKDEHTLPPVPIEKSDLMKLYQSLKPKSLADYRNRCILGFILFQGLKRIELEEIQISDVNFEQYNVFIRSQRKSNSRWLDLERVQILHLHEYLKKHRKKLLRKKNVDTDKFFLSSGRSENLEGVFCRILKQVKDLIRRL